jgi:hypothetical protein
MLTTKSGQPKERASFQDCHWLTLGWTVATGEHVMYDIIIPSKTPPSNDYITVFNAMAKLEENIVLDRDNPDPIFEDGDDKVYLMGTTCIFNGKTISTFVTTTENGSITAKALTDMLRYMDKLEVFDHIDGVPPMVILDGRNSRFGSEYLEYCNNKQHLWTIMLGVAYAINLWQGVDSPKQNGAFKIDLSR